MSYFQFIKADLNTKYSKKSFNQNMLIQNMIILDNIY